MTNERIEKAVDVIYYAIDNGVSLKKASKLCGYSDTYVKNVIPIVYENYKNGTLNEQQYFKFNDAYMKYKNTETKIFKVNIAGIPNEEVNEYVKNAASNFRLETEKNGVKFNTVENDNTTFKQDGKKAEVEWKGTNYPKGHIKTLKQLLETAEVDLDVWKVRSHIINKWDVTSWKNDSAETIQNFQVKATLERVEELVVSKNAAELFKNMVRDYVPKLLDVTPIDTTTREKNLLEISIFDLHIGKLAWGGETFENYDTKIARERFLYSIETLLHRASGFQYNRILFPIGNDFFNSDTIYNTTTKGTPQDEDLRWQKTFNVGTRLLVDAINMLKQNGVPVDVVVIPGNHDFERSYYMGSYLEAWFNNDPLVHVNNGASPRKYYRYGKVLLGLTHGSEEKEASLPLLMATDIESKPMWSETLYHEWHLGHQHRKKNVKYTILNKSQTLAEDLGVTVRYLSSLTGTEEWHHKKGYVGSVKAADAFIWNDELGMVAHLNSNLVL